MPYGPQRGGIWLLGGGGGWSSPCMQQFEHLEIATENFQKIHSVDGIPQSFWGWLPPHMLPSMIKERMGVFRKGKCSTSGVKMILQILQESRLQALRELRDNLYRTVPMDKEACSLRFLKFSCPKALLLGPSKLATSIAALPSVTMQYRSQHGILESRTQQFCSQLAQPADVRMIGPTNRNRNQRNRFRSKPGTEKQIIAKGALSLTGSPESLRIGPFSRISREWSDSSCFSTLCGLFNKTPSPKDLLSEPGKSRAGIAWPVFQKPKKQNHNQMLFLLPHLWAKCSGPFLAIYRFFPPSCGKTLQFTPDLST